MTAQPVAPVIPSASRGHVRQGKPGADRRLGPGRRPGDHRCAGLARGDRLTLTTEDGVLITRRDPGGMVTVPATRPYIVIPAALRRRCGLRAGDHVLLCPTSRIPTRPKTT